MELMTTNSNKLAEIIELAEKKNIKPVDWFNFCGKVNDIWFKGDLTWNQMEIIKDWAWQVKSIRNVEYVFGAIITAYETNCISW
jgi:uncharacterized lipoprotein YddW (UPF0748 family)